MKVKRLVLAGTAVTATLLSSQEGRFGGPHFIADLRNEPKSTNKGSTRPADLNCLRFLHRIFIPPQYKLPDLQ
jgi:hypothetical protein